MVAEAKGVSDMSDVLARIEAALARGEAAADRMDRRHNKLRQVAQSTIASLDRLIEAERMKAHG